MGKRLYLSHKRQNDDYTKAYKDLDMNEYRRAVRDTGFVDFVSLAEEIVSKQMRLVSFNYDEDEYELVCFVKGNTDLYIVEHSHEGIFMGYNLYARPEGETSLILLEGYDDYESAKNVMDDIKFGLTLGMEYFRLPANCGEDEDE